MRYLPGRSRTTRTRVVVAVPLFAGLLFVVLTLVDLVGGDDSLGHLLLWNAVQVAITTVLWTAFMWLAVWRRRARVRPRPDLS